MSRYPQLDRDSLARLRTLARAIHEGDRGAVPLKHLLRLASEVRIDAGVTIDLEASRDLGEPLIVIVEARGGLGKLFVVGAAARAHA